MDVVKKRADNSFRLPALWLYQYTHTGFESSWKLRNERFHQKSSASIVKKATAGFGRGFPERRSLAKLFPATGTAYNVNV